MEHMLKLQQAEARPAWYGDVRDAIASVVFVFHATLAGIFVSRLYGDQQSFLASSARESIGDVTAMLGLVLVAFLIRGTRLLPIASATLPPLLLCQLPVERRVLAGLLTCWLVAHIGVLLYCLWRRLRIVR